MILFVIAGALVLLACILPFLGFALFGDEVPGWMGQPITAIWLVILAWAIALVGVWQVWG